MRPSNAAANKAVRFINNLTHTGDYSGQPFQLRPWQESIIRRLFGTLKKDGRRQFKRCFLFLSRKQAKTELSAAICVFMLVSGGQGQEIYSAAASREQAARI